MTEIENLAKTEIEELANWLLDEQMNLTQKLQRFINPCLNTSKHYFLAYNVSLSTILEHTEKLNKIIKVIEKYNKEYKEHAQE